MSRVSWSLKEGGLDALLIAVVAIALTVVGVWLPPPSHQTYLVGLLGSILGAILGLLSSPYNSGDKALFKGYEKLIYGFFSGWLLTRVNTFLDKEEHVTLLLQAPVLLLGAYFLCWFFLAALSIFVYRRYY